MDFPEGWNEILFEGFILSCDNVYEVVRKILIHFMI